MRTPSEHASQLPRTPEETAVMLPEVLDKEFSKEEKAVDPLDVPLSV